MSTVTITCFYKNISWTLGFDDTMTMYDVLDYMIQKKYIPNGLSVRQRKTSPWYPHIHDGTELLFYNPSSERFSGILYGCPSAKDTPGIVPTCMLNTFEGYIVSEV